MTVAELRDKLAEYPRDADVYFEWEAPSPHGNDEIWAFDHEVYALRHTEPNDLWPSGSVYLRGDDFK